MIRQIQWSFRAGEAVCAFIAPVPCKRFTAGGAGCDVPLPGAGDARLVCVLEDEGAHITCENGALLCEDGRDTQDARVTRDTCLAVADAQGTERFTMSVAFVEPSEPPSLDRVITLPDGTTRFGGVTGCAVRFTQPGAPGVAFAIYSDASGAVVEAGDTALGLYVNSRQAPKGRRQALADGDFLFVPGMTFLYMAGNVLSTTRAAVYGAHYTDSAEQNSHLVYPRMSRTSRYHDVAPTEPIEVLDPPALPEQNDRNLLISVLPSLLMVLLFVLVRSSASSGSGLMLFSVMSMALGAVASVFTFFANKRANRRKCAERESSYMRYIAEMSAKIVAARERERAILRRIYIEPERELRNVEDFSADLFDRTTSDADFLDIRLGYGTLPSRQVVKRRVHQVFEKTDSLFLQPELLADKFHDTPGLPAYIHAREANAIGFLGNLQTLRDMMNLVTVDLATRQFPSDMALYYLCGPEFEVQMAASRMLPHVSGGQPGARNIACDAQSRDVLLEELYRHFSLREESKDACQGAPWMVIFIQADDDVTRHPLMQYIPHAARLHAVFLFFAQHRERLPLGCRYMVRLMSNERSGLLVDMFDREGDRLFAYPAMPDAAVERMSQRLAPVYCNDINLSGTLVRSCTLFDALNVERAAPDDVLAAWARADVRQSLAAPLGVLAGGAWLCLDVHEAAHGPHGLVAGTTGSGKSEVLISYILSMAYHFSPEDVVFLVIDFKGGGMTTHLAGLPHLIGSITNLNDHEMARSLASIRAELRRRQMALSMANVSSINDYHREYRAGRAQKPLPHLMIIVDEFAELKAQQPDFMDELISTARIGRSLGVHMILATQRPTGIVNEQITSNTNFSLCLRVQSKEDSNLVIHSPLAAEIREPGRAYLQSSRLSVFKLFQSGYAGARADASGQKKEPAFEICQLSLSGRRTRLYAHMPGGAREGDARPLTQGDAVLQAIGRAYARLQCPPPDRLCLPPLPVRLPFTRPQITKPYCLPVGLYDKPETQEQGVVSFEPLTGHLLVTGASQTGKTNLLMTLCRAAAEAMTSKEIVIYALDFNTGIFATLSGLAIMGGVVLTDQEERLRNLLKLLRQEIVSRKAMFLQENATSLSGYLDAGKAPLPAILVLIDNFSVFKELYDERYGDELLYLLREGLPFGVTCCVSAPQSTVMGYRRMCYFNHRYVLYSSDRSEYAAMLDGCRKVLAEIPGRMLFRQQKELLEAQLCLAFDGENERERGAACARFVREHAAGGRARAIPEVPDTLTATALRAMFDLPDDALEFCYGMDFADVEPVSIRLNRQFELALVGGGEVSARFIMALLEHLKLPAMDGLANIRIVDNYDRRLKDYRNAPYVALYTLDHTQAGVQLQEVEALLRARHEAVQKDGVEALRDMPLEVVILNSREAMNGISASVELMQVFTGIGEKYRAMKVLFVFADIDNRAVSYTSPALLRRIKETRQALVFDNLPAIRMFDFPLATIRQYQTSIGRDDAYRVDDDAVSRVKLALPAFTP